MTRGNLLRAALAFAATCACAAAHAETYYVDPARSYLAWSGRVAFAASGTGTATSLVASVPFGFSVSGGGLLVEQGAGSMKTALAGTVTASASPGLLTFSAADIVALPSGSWRPDSAANPAATSPANLGARAAIAPQVTLSGGAVVEGVADVLAGFLASGIQGTAYGAARDLRIGLAPAIVPLAGGGFPLDAVVAQIIAGVLYGSYDAPAATAGTSTSVAGGAASLNSPGVLGAWSEADGVRTLDMALALPEQAAAFALGGQSAGGGAAGVSYRALIEAGDLTLHYTLAGRIVASTDVAAVPEPSTHALLLAGLVGLAWLARRRRVLDGRYESC